MPTILPIIPISPVFGLPLLLPLPLWYFSKSLKVLSSSTLVSSALAITSFACFSISLSWLEELSIAPAVLLLTLVLLLLSALSSLSSSSGMFSAGSSSLTSPSSPTS